MKGKESGEKGSSSEDIMEEEGSGQKGGGEGNPVMNGDERLHTRIIACGGLETSPGSVKGDAEGNCVMATEPTEMAGVSTASLALSLGPTANSGNGTLLKGWLPGTSQTRSLTPGLTQADAHLSSAAQVDFDSGEAPPGITNGWQRQELQGQGGRQGKQVVLKEQAVQQQGQLQGQTQQHEEHEQRMMQDQEKQEGPEQHDPQGQKGQQGQPKEQEEKGQQEEQGQQRHEGQRQGHRQEREQGQQQGQKQQKKQQNKRNAQHGSVLPRQHARQRRCQQAHSLPQQHQQQQLQCEAACECGNHAVLRRGMFYCCTFAKRPGLPANRVSDGVRQDDNAMV